MIYHFNIRNEYNEDKAFFLSADNHSQLFRRILSTYGITKDKVEILEEYEETSDWGYKLVKSSIAHLSDKDKEIKKQAKEIFAKNSRKCEPYKSEAIAKYKYKDAVNISGEKDLIPLLKKYKKVKVYWELTEQRGVHQYYALVK